MKKTAILFLYFVILFIYHINAQNIYDFKISGANGKRIQLSDYSGRKILIITLAASQTQEDSAFLQRINSIAASNNKSLKIIAVPPYEIIGGPDSAKISIAWYQSQLSSKVLLSVPLCINNASLLPQARLFKWLTHSAENKHFDYEVKSAGAMFLINESGELTGIIGPEGKFSDKILQKILN